MRDAELARMLRLADEPSAPSAFVEALWSELESAWDGGGGFASDGEAEIAEHALVGSASQRVAPGRLVGPGLAAAVLAGVLVVAGFLFFLVSGDDGTDLVSQPVDVEQACARFRSEAPGLRDLQAGAMISEDRLRDVVGALGVLATDLESSGEVPLESVRSVRAAAGGLRQAVARLSEGEAAAAQVNIEFALVALGEVNRAPVVGSCFVYTGSQTP